MNLYAKLGIALGAVLLLAASTIGVLRAIDSVYDAGYDAGKLAIQAEQQQAVIDAQNKIIDLNAQLAKLGTEYARLETEALLRAQEGPETVTRIIREAPEFQCVRPAALAARRLQDLRLIAAAADRNQDPVPADGVQALPGAGDRP